MRAAIVTNMYPNADNPAFGSFVRDQVEALRRTDAVELEVIEVPSGSAKGYARAMLGLRRRRSRVDVVHAHFGLSAWPSLSLPARAHVLTLHGTDLRHPRSRAITLSSLPFFDLVATVSPRLAETLPRWLPQARRAVLPCGVDLLRFNQVDRAKARSELGLDPSLRHVLFPADPSRAEKRFDLARELAREVGAGLLTLGRVEPQRVPIYVNAADAVLVTSEREGFGLGVLEALACDVPVLSTDVGIAPHVLHGVEGTLCAPFDEPIWKAHLEKILEHPDPRIRGRCRAEPFSSDRMAADVLSAWQALVQEA